MGEDRHEQASSSTPMPLMESLKRDWAKGALSAKQVQEYAHGAHQQGAVGMEAPAKAGSWGKHGQNCHRSLMTLFGQPAGAPEITWVEVPTKKGNVLHPFMLPHMWFSSLYSHQPGTFKDKMQGPEGACNAYWTMSAATPFVQQHPVLEPSLFGKTVPVGLYGDAGSINKQESLYVFTWNSLLGTGPTMSKRYLTTCIKKTDVVDGTFDEIFRVLAWSYNVMLTGISPETDWMHRKIEGGGKYLAGGLRACLAQVRGDWEFYCSIFRFPKWNEAANMCWMCDASANGPLAFANCSADAPWRATRRTHESYVLKLAADGLPLPSLFQHVIGLRLENIMIYIIHALDLGFAAHLVGNVFQLCLAKKVWSPGNREDNLAGLNKELDQWYKDEKIQSKIKGKLTQERIKTSGSWPKLKAKGAATRHAVPFALTLAHKHCDRRVVALCQLLCEFYQIIDAQGIFLDDEAKARLPVLGRQMCSLYALLATDALNAGKKCWKMTPKVHLVQHLLEWQAPSVGNPRFYWTYADEDLVGSMIEVAESCHSSTMAVTCMVKWLVFAFEL